MPSDEGKEVLRLLAEGKIDAEQAYRLLRALGDAPGEGERVQPEAGEDRREGTRAGSREWSRGALRRWMRGKYGPRGFKSDLAEEAPRPGAGKLLRIRITEGGRQKVNIAVPLGLARLGRMRGIADNIARRFDIDLDEILRAVEASAGGKIVDVVDEEGGDRVEVYVE